MNSTGKLLVRMEGYIFEVAESDLDAEMDYNCAIEYCKKQSDQWRLPTKHELIEIYKQLVMLGRGNFDLNKYLWSSNRMHNLENGFAIKMSEIEKTFVCFLEEDNYVRSVRNII